MIRKAVFPAAGYGTRFLPATKASPKEMLPLVDKPLIQHGVEEALASGLRDMIIVTGRGKNAIEDHFDVSFELEATLRKKGDAMMLDIVRRISDSGDFFYGREDLQRIVERSAGILGVPISFDAKGDVIGGLIFVYQVRGMGFQQVKTIVVK